MSEAHRGKGVGTGFLGRTISDCSRLGIEIIVAILLGSNAPSINLLLKFGFEEWGRLSGNAEIDANRYDHTYMGKRLWEGLSPASADVPKDTGWGLCGWRPLGHDSSCPGFL
ncbi:N-acetyltransferase family protein [Candidatus Pelagisphaera phototrophica]|uniref:GNAT family N-acetyltransferase n=1 Tax=Candidatus Pelagisphaera phototrophica TaxID=2684113 RepID=UPI003CCC926E